MPCTLMEKGRQNPPFKCKAWVCGYEVFISLLGRMGGPRRLVTVTELSLGGEDLPPRPLLGTLQPGSLC